MWDDGDGELGCKDDGGLGKYLQGTTPNLKAYRCSDIMGMADKVSGEDMQDNRYGRQDQK